jgi:hypothetical protein
MERSMLAFAISAAVVLTTETSYATQSAGGGKTVPTPRDRPASAASTRTTGKNTKTPEPSAVQQALRSDPLLAAMVSGRLPVGTNLMVVAAGFRDITQFVGAVNASKNLGIPFHHLKRRMVNDGMSLGLAIQDMLPRSDYRSATRQAEKEASAIVGRP